jgi:hypothetical protein
VKSTPTDLVLALVTACVVASACSGVSSPALSQDDGASGSTSDAANENVSSSGGSGSSSESGAGMADSGRGVDASPNVTVDAAPVDVCGALPTPATCQSCCASTHTKGYQTYNVALQSCACSAKGGCQSLCMKEYCTNAATGNGDPCANCVSKVQASGGACFDAINTACKADTDCLALYSSTGCFAGCMAIGVGAGGG